MNNKAVFISVIIVGLCIMFAALTVYSQDYITHVKDSGFENRIRPFVPFAHDEHNEIAELYDCAVCHHMYEDGILLEDESSEGYECSECHTPENPRNPFTLSRVYHLQCKGCHLTSGKGPITCGDCHKK